MNMNINQASPLFGCCLRPRAWLCLYEWGFTLSQWSSQLWLHEQSTIVGFCAVHESREL